MAKSKEKLGLRNLNGLLSSKLYSIYILQGNVILIFQGKKKKVQTYVSIIFQSICKYSSGFYIVYIYKTYSHTYKFQI